MSQLWVGLEPYLSLILAIVSKFKCLGILHLTGKKFHLGDRALTSQTSDKKRCHKTRQKGTKIA